MCLLPAYTPWKIKGWNLKVRHLFEIRKIIYRKPSNYQVPAVKSSLKGHRKDVRVYLDPPEQPPDSLNLGEERSHWGSLTKIISLAHHVWQHEC